MRGLRTAVLDQSIVILGQSIALLHQSIANAEGVRQFQPRATPWGKKREQSSHQTLKEFASLEAVILMMASPPADSAVPVFCELFQSFVRMILASIPGRYHPTRAARAGTPVCPGLELANACGVGVAAFIHLMTQVYYYRLIGLPFRANHSPPG
jgi:hypothetical protein